MREQTYVVDLLLKLPLYSPVSLAETPLAVRDIRLYADSVDTFCPGCGQHATFRGFVPDTDDQLRMIAAAMTAKGQADLWGKEPFFSKVLECTRSRHLLRFYFLQEHNKLIKVGQYPSIADIEVGDTAKYSWALGKSRLRELNKGIGLAAHGVGVGAYVYLRRVFESLVEEAHIKAATAQGWDEDAYQRARVTEKVKLLRGWVPEFLLEQPQMYSILSFGIHQLTEEQCLEHFEPLKEAIFVIAEEKLIEEQRARRAAAASKALTSIAGTLGGVAGKAEGAPG